MNRNLSKFIQNILICVSKMNESYISFEDEDDFSFLGELSL